MRMYYLLAHHIHENQLFSTDPLLQSNHKDFIDNYFSNDLVLNFSELFVLFNKENKFEYMDEATTKVSKLNLKLD